MTKHSNYRPHPRLQEFGEITNPINGEVTQPPSMTKQEFKRECDINNIIKQFSRTGMFTHVSANANAGAYEQLPDSYDFQESLHIIMEAEKAFMSLPAKTRERFGNEPSNFLTFMHDERNKEEIYSLGLAVKPHPQVPPSNGSGPDLSPEATNSPPKA